MIIEPGDVPDRAGKTVVRSSSPLMSVHVLVIDDDVRLFEVLDNYLTQNGVRSSHASNGLNGLAVLESGAFDAVLLDVMMPGLDGLAVLKKIRERSRLGTRPTAWLVSSSGPTTTWASRSARASFWQDFVRCSGAPSSIPARSI